MSNEKKFVTFRDLKMAKPGQSPVSSTPLDPSSDTLTNPSAQKLNTRSEQVVEENQINLALTNEDFASTIDTNESLSNSSENMVASHPEVASHQLATKTQKWLATASHQNAKVASHQSEKAASHQNAKVASHQNAKVASHQKRRGDRHANNKALLAVRLQNTFLDEIKFFCEKHSLPIQEFIQLAASHYMDLVASHPEVASHQNKKVLATKSQKWLAHDDLKIFKTHDDIIMLFHRITGRKWTAADDRVGVKLNEADRRLIEIGMINTFLQARGRRINSFAYFLPEIQTVLEVKIDPDHIDSYLRRRREQLAAILEKQTK